VAARVRTTTARVPLRAILRGDGPGEQRPNALTTQTGAQLPFYQPLDVAVCSSCKAKSSLGDAKSSLGDAESSLGDAKSSLGDVKSSVGDAKSSLGDVKSSLGDAKSSLGDVKSSVGDAKSSVGDVKSSVGDAKSSVGDVKSSVGDAKSSVGAGNAGAWLQCVACRRRRCRRRAVGAARAPRACR
jgi:uncharacterized protein YjbJ (UPF0337 family)